MKNSNYFKIASTLLALSVFAGCASLPVQQGEYDDVYFTSADRAQPKTVVIDLEGKGDLGENVVTLEKSSDEKVQADLISRYNNGSPQEVVYFEEIDPRVSKASELNYDDFVWDYNNELLKNYDLPLEWDDMDAFTFNDIVANDFSFRNAWYEQYYRGNTSLMDAYVSNSSSTRNNRGFGSSNININMGFGLGFGGFGSPFRSSIFWGDPFYSSYAGFYDPFWSYGFSRRSMWYSSFHNPYAWGYDPFWGPDPYFNSYYSWNRNSWRWRRNNWYWGGNTIIIANNDYYGNGRNYTRGGRVPSTSITSVRSDAVNGSGRTRSSAALSNASGTRSTISSGRVSNNSVRSSAVSGTRSSRSTSSVDEALRRSSNRVRTDAYRISSDGRSNSSVRSRSPISNRMSSSNYRSSTSRSSIPSYSRTSSSRNSGISFNRNTSSRSSSSVFNRSRSSSSRSIGFSRGSSSSSRSSGFSRGSSSSSSRSSGSVSRSSGSSSRSSSSSGSSRSSSSSSGSRGGRGN